MLFVQGTINRSVTESMSCVCTCCNCLSIFEWEINIREIGVQFQVLTLMYCGLVLSLNSLLSTTTWITPMQMNRTEWNTLQVSIMAEKKSGKIVLRTAWIIMSLLEPVHIKSKSALKPTILGQNWLIAQFFWKEFEGFGNYFDSLCTRPKSNNLRC